MGIIINDTGCHAYPCRQSYTAYIVVHCHDAIPSTACWHNTCPLLHPWSISVVNCQDSYSMHYWWDEWINTDFREQIHYWPQNIVGWCTTGLRGRTVDIGDVVPLRTTYQWHFHNILICIDHLTPQWSINIALWLYCPRQRCMQMSTLRGVTWSAVQCTFLE